MPEQPPVELVAMLERLGLATAVQIARMGRRVRRLARDLPRFESVWVDALLQARILTPFQAAEINDGRGESLRIGPYVLYERLPHPYYVACYRARNVDSQEPARLAVVDDAGPRAEAILRQLESLVGCVKRTDGKIENAENPGALHAPYELESLVGCVRRTDEMLPSPLSPLLSPLSPIAHTGVDGARIFAAAPWVEGRTAAEWMVHHGRFPPEVVLEIARTMLAGLIELEEIGICHGDVGTSSLILTDAGGAALSLPGLRGILRPEEGYAYADLLPEAYDSLAPERIAAGTPPSAQSDIYACGCVWWHLLCGRPPLPGGSSLAKLRAAQAGEVCDVRRYALDVAPPLAAAISACLEREPSRRPESMARLAAMLGPPTRGGQEALADCLARAGRPAVHWTATVRSIRRSNRTPLWIAGAVCCLVAAVTLLWPSWHGRSASNTTTEGLGMAMLSKETVRSTEYKVRSTEKSGGIANQQSTINNQQSVVPAAYQQVETRPPDLVLAAGKPLGIASLNLRRGQCVRGPSGSRAAILVPRAGLVVDKEGICFENIDFVYPLVGQPPSAVLGDSAQPGAAVLRGPKTAEPALVQLLASRAEFRGCRFQCDEKGFMPISAIRWVHPAQAEKTETSLPNGRLQLTDCLLHRVGVGVDCRTAGALAIELQNTLHLDAGPLVRLDHCPQSDEPVSIVLGQVTLRGGGPLLECLVPRIEEQPGEITVLATACALVPEPGVPLVRVTGAEMPERLLTAVRWSGQGSLVTPRTPIIAWRGPDGRQQAVDESSLSIAGLVRSEVGFAGEASNDPAASRLIRWQAPLQSADPPGIDPGAIPNGGRMRDER